MEFDPRARVPRDRIAPVAVVSQTSVVAMSLLDNMSEASSVSRPVREASTEAKMPAPAPTPAHDRSGRASESPTESPAPAEKLFRIQFSASEAFMAQLERFRALASHRLPANASLEQVFAVALGYFIEQEDPSKRHERRGQRLEKKRSATDPKSATMNNAPRPQQQCPPNRRRPIPVVVRDAIFSRDQGRCTFVGSNGKRCDSTHVLQIDHVQPVALGGTNTPDNLRLLCAHHNRFEAERLLGP